MTTLNRRQIFMLILATGLAAAGPSWAQPELRKVTVALDWTPNTNHIGLYVARDKGFYAEAGLEVEILPYGDTSSGTLISNGVADFGVIGAIGFFTQRTAGADLKAVYAVVRPRPAGWCSMQRARTSRARRTSTGSPMAASAATGKMR